MAIKRNSKGQFIKGVSGNPSGRPPGSIVDMIDKAVTLEDWSIVLEKVLQKAKYGDLRAIELLLDRRFGKPVQQNELTGKGGSPLFERMSDDELLAELRAIINEP